MEARKTKTDFSITGRIDARTHSIDRLEKAADSDFDSLSKEEKLELSRKVEPEYEETAYNVTTDRFHEYLVDNLDPGNSGNEANLSVAWLGLGTDSASGTNTSDTDLNNRTFEEPVTDVADNGKELLASTFLASTEGNNNTFDELGLFTGNPADLANNDVFLINHATFADVTKDNSKTVTFDVTLTFSDV